MMELNEILTKLGFSEYKKKAYISLIKLEKATVGEISKKSNIPSSKIYEILHWLFENGYISIVNKKPLTYKANNPKSILKSEVKEKISDLKEIELKINKLATTLETSEKANFEVVYGRDNFFKRVKEASSKSKKSIIAIVKSWRMDYELREININFFKKGGKIKFLGPITKLNKNRIEEWKKLGTQIKHFIPESTRFTVWDGKIVTIGFKDNLTKDYFSLWIENEYLGKILTKYFDEIWSNN